MDERPLKAIPPVHCLAAADHWDLLNIEAADCDGRHQPAADAFALVADWLRQAMSDLRVGKLGRVAMTHPSRSAPPLEFHDIDPTTAHVLITGGRRGVNDALDAERPAVYVGVAAQATTTQWRGLAGSFLPLCSCPDEARGRAPALRLLETLGLTPRGSQDLPYGLAPSDQWPTWLDERFVASARLFPTADVWRSVTAHQLSDDQPILITTGPRLSDEPNVMYLASARDVALLVSNLPATLTCRRGSAAELLRLCSEDDGPVAETVRMTLSRRSRAAPAGWCVVLTPDGPSEVARSCLLWRDANHSVPTVDVRYAPRLRGGLAVDGSVLIDILGSGRDDSCTR